MKRVKQFDEHFDRKELVDNIYESLKDYQTREEIEEFVGEGFFDFIKGLVLNPIKKRQLNKLADRLVAVRIQIGKLQIEGDEVEQFEDELESKYDDYDYNAPTAPKSNKGTSSTHDVKIEMLEAEEEDIITMMDAIGEENETLEKYVSKIKLEARFKSTEALMRFADSDIKHTLQKMAQQDKKKIDTLDKQIKKEVND
jgi:hypothetical protein